MKTRLDQIGVDVCGARSKGIMTSLSECNAKGLFLNVCEREEKPANEIITIIMESQKEGYCNIAQRNNLIESRLKKSIFDISFF